MPAHRSQTHWQVAQKADTRIKTGQRVCLPQRTERKTIQQK